MVNSHAKNATTQSTLTYAERARLKATSGSRRIGGESFKPYDHCHLCLSLLVSPVSCSKGHMYCRECAISDLIQQKAGIESQKREMERWAAKEEGERQDARAAARERVVRDFEKSMGVGWVGAGGAGAGKGDAGGVVGGEGGGRKKGVEELMKEAEDRAMKKIEAEQAESRKAKLPAFWLPSLAPEGRVGPIKDVKVQALCHFGGEPHAISRKTLLPVILHYPATSKTPHCPSCSRELSNAVPSVLLSSREPASASISDDRPKKKKKADKEEPYVCGHVFCKSCADTMIKPAGRCSVCEAKIGPEGMIAMGKEGTGFAAAGGSEVKSNSIVFRV